MEYVYRFSVGGRRIRATARQVEEALRGVAPERIRVHWVQVGSTRYPVKQALALAFNLDPSDFITQVARRVFVRLGFQVFSRARPAKPTRDEEDADTEGAPAQAPATGARPRFPRASGHVRPPRAEVDSEQGEPVAQAQVLELPPIVLEWSPWVSWDELYEDHRGVRGVQIPDQKPGVYEVMIEGGHGMLTIGRGINLRARIKQGMIRATNIHHAGEKIRRHEDTSRVFVRWALTDRPAAAEEELHKQHIRDHGRLPKHTHHT